jgi:hypothetical protein
MMLIFARVITEILFTTLHANGYRNTTMPMQDTRYIKYAKQKRNTRNDRITVKYPA